MSTSVAFSSGVSNSAKSIPAAANAASVGAKTVNGPSPCRVSTSPACVSAATNESWTPVAAAFVGISSDSSAATFSGRVVINRLAKMRDAIARFMDVMHHSPYLNNCYPKAVKTVNGIHRHLLLYGAVDCILQRGHYVLVHRS